MAGPTLQQTLCQYLTRPLTAVWSVPEGLRIADVNPHALDGSALFSSGHVFSARYARDFSVFTECGLPVTPLLASALNDPSAFWAQVRRLGPEASGYGQMMHHYMNEATIHFLHRWKGGAPGDIIEIGAGTCILSRMIADDTGRRVVATDIRPSPGDLYTARGSVTHQVADATALPFADASFYGAAASLTIGYVQEPGLSELYRVLQTGGTVAAICHYAQSGVTNWVIRLGELSALILALNAVSEDDQQKLLRAQIGALLYPATARLFDGRQLRKKQTAYVAHMDRATRGALTEDEQLNFVLQALVGTRLGWAWDKSPEQLARVFTDVGFTHVKTTALIHTMADCNARFTVLGVTGRK